jgi:hypothetical protein
MRYVLIGIGASVAAITAGTLPSHAGPWCLQGGLLARGGMDDCGYHSLAQCKASGGNGAAPCVPNKLLLWRELERSRAQPVAKSPTRKPR